jgi:hypothetical protein
MCVAPALPPPLPLSARDRQTPNATSNFPERDLWRVSEISVVRLARQSSKRMGIARLLTLFSPLLKIPLVMVVSTAMLQGSIRKIVCLAAFAALADPLAFSQEASDLKPPQYRGVAVFVDGIFVSPVPGAPLTAIVELQSTQILADGSTEVRKSIANIARDSQGRIYNERRQLVSPSFTGNPQLLSFHIFDPETRLNTFLNPSTHIARHTISSAPAPVAEPRPGAPLSAHQPLVDGEDLGTEIMENVVVHGIRKTITVPATASGTGKAVVVTDEYWYSDELRLNMLVKHDDPRSGQQTVTVTHVDRSEPDQAMFKVPAGFKVVEENPEN